jgi:hypothetical protein
MDSSSSHVVSTDGWPCQWISSSVHLLRLHVPSTLADLATCLLSYIFFSCPWANLQSRKEDNKVRWKNVWVMWNNRWSLYPKSNKRLGTRWQRFFIFSLTKGKTQQKDGESSRGKNCETERENSNSGEQQPLVTHRHVNYDFPQFNGEEDPTAWPGLSSGLVLEVSRNPWKWEDNSHFSIWKEELSYGFKSCYAKDGM